MQSDNQHQQTQLARAMSAMSQSIGSELGLNGAQIIESMVYGLAMACADMASPENREVCITEASKLLLSYATQVTANTPPQSLATH